jgi:hypothetical protein
VGALQRILVLLFTFSRINLLILRLFSHLFIDSFNFPKVILKEILTGYAGSMQITQGFLFAGSILMEIPILMILLSLVLKRKWNRIANIIAGAIKTLAIFGTMFVGTPTLYYIFFGVIEIIITVSIISIAWTWKK